MYKHNFTGFIYAGEEITFIINQCGKCYYSGGIVIDENESLKSHVPKYLTLQNREKEFIVQLKSNNDHGALLTKKGELIVFGDKHYVINGKFKVPNNEKIIDFSIGGYHIIACSESGKAYSLGWNKEGCLGCGDDQNPHCPVEVKLADGVNAVKVKAACCSSMILSKDGRIFTFGSGYDGILGHGNEQNQLIPVEVKIPTKSKIIDLDFGLSHTIVCDENGSVFTFGHGGHGCLGHGDTKGSFTPVKVKSLSKEKIVQVGAGNSYSIARTEDGRVFTFGYKLGIPLSDYYDRHNQLIPVEMKSLRKQKIVNISAGRKHAIIYDEDGRVFTFGYGYNGALGHGNSKSQLAPVEIKNICMFGNGYKFRQALFEHKNNSSLLSKQNILGNGKSDPQLCRVFFK